MADLMPIPIGKESGSPKPIHPASEQISSWLNNYMPKFLENAMARSPGGKGNGSGGGGNIAKMLYEAVHPDTFNRVMDALKPPIKARAEGGPADPSQDYLVGEKGPEIFRPNKPGDVIPIGGTDRSLTYMGQGSTRDPLQQGGPIGNLMSQYEGGAINPENTPGAPSTFKGSLLDKYVVDPLRRFSENRAAAVGMPGATGATPLPETPSPIGTPAAPYTGNRPWRQHAGATPIGPQTPAPVGGMQNYDEGIQYQMGAPNPAGNAMARMNLLNRVPEAAGMNFGAGGPPGVGGGSYYDAHPEERAMDYMTEANRPLMEAYQKQLEQNMNMMQGFGLPMGPKSAQAARLQAMKNIPAIQANMNNLAGFPAEMYKTGMEFGPGSPASQERLAHASYYRNMPGMEMYRINATNQAHLAGIQTEVEGHLGAAQIAASVKDPFIKTLGTVLAQGYQNSERTGIPFDDRKTTASLLKIAKATGQITDEQWEKIPDEFKKEGWTEKTLRADLKKNKMKDKDIDAYIKRAKEIGAI